MFIDGIITDLKESFTDFGYEVKLLQEKNENLEKRVKFLEEKLGNAA